MKTNKFYYICFYSLAMFAYLFMPSSCVNDIDDPIPNNGRILTISASIEESFSRASYTDDVVNKKLSVDWEATEKISVISIGDNGIRSIDEFTSTGTAGRDIAEFTGTFNGVDGDKVVCLYPAVTTTAGQARFSGVSVGATQIELNFPAHSPSTDISSLKDWDVMVGSVEISGNTASVKLYRQIAVLKLGVQGVYPWDGSSGSYITGLGVSATDANGNAKAFASHGAMTMTKTGFSPYFSPDQYYTSGHFAITQQSQSGEYMYYIPIFGNGSLVAGDKLKVDGQKRERWGYGKWEQSEYDKTFTIPADRTMSFLRGTVVVAHVEL